MSKEHIWYSIKHNCDYYTMYYRLDDVYGYVYSEPIEEGDIFHPFYEIVRRSTALCAIQSAINSNK